MKEYYVANEEDMLCHGQALANGLQGGITIFFYGDLGAGKTTLIRGLLRGLGVKGSVKSPTFTLLEPYTCEHLSINHFDLYRLSDAEELEYLGIRDYCTAEAINLIEWPEKGQDRLPPADVHCYIDINLPGRRVRWQANSPKGQQFLQQDENSP